MAEGEKGRRGRSRKYKNGRGRMIFSAVLTCIIIILVTAGVVFTCTYLYHYWEGSQTSTQPLETGREVVPETMEDFNGL